MGIDVIKFPGRSCEVLLITRTTRCKPCQFPQPQVHKLIRASSQNFDLKNYLVFEMFKETASLWGGKLNANVYWIFFHENYFKSYFNSKFRLKNIRNQNLDLIKSIISLRSWSVVLKVLRKGFLYIQNASLLVTVLTIIVVLWNIFLSNIHVYINSILLTLLFLTLWQHVLIQ